MNCTVANSDVNCMLIDVSIMGPNEGGILQVIFFCSKTIMINLGVKIMSLDPLESVEPTGHHPVRVPTR